MALLDPVLHLTTLTVDVLIEEARIAISMLEIGDDEARVGIAARPFGLADNAPFAAPALERAVFEVGEVARTNKDGSIVSREQKKQDQYEAAGIPSTVKKLPPSGN